MVMKTDSPPGKRYLYVCTGNTTRKDEEGDRKRESKEGREDYS
jgi:hypothetical protein